MVWSLYVHYSHKEEFLWAVKSVTHPLGVLQLTVLCNLQSPVPLATDRRSSQRNVKEGECSVKVLPKQVLSADYREVKIYLQLGTSKKHPFKQIYPLKKKNGKHNIFLFVYAAAASNISHSSLTLLSTPLESLFFFFEG